MTVFADSKVKSSGWVSRTNEASAVSAVVKSNPNAPAKLPWRAGLTAEQKLLLLLASEFGALSARSRGDKFKFYYSVSHEGSWFAEIWSGWKVSAWALALAFLGLGFWYWKSGAGCLAVGVASLLVFGPRMFLAYKYGAVAAPLTNRHFALEALPLMMVMTVAGAALVEWGFRLPFQSRALLQALVELKFFLTMGDGIFAFGWGVMKMALTMLATTAGAVLVYQLIGGGRALVWLYEADSRGYLQTLRPEPGTWFFKMLTTGENPKAGYFRFVLGVAAVAAFLLPWL